jgi:ATP-dependent exoDNAse (exonuclease V) beta subunit
MSKLINKFNYKELTRAQVDGKRLYATPDGARVPSVTTILDKTKSKEKQEALQQWRNRVGHEKAQQITTEAANRGTRMHTYLEHYVKDGVLKERGSNPFGWPSYDMAKTVINEGLGHVDEFWGVEVPLYFPGIYAGTTDCVGVHKGAPAILDFKQTNKPKKTEWIEDYFLQLAAYAEAHNEVYGTKINKGVILMCAKPTESEPGIYSKPPEYQQWIIEGDEFEHWRNQWWKRVEQYYESQIV